MFGNAVDGSPSVKKLFDLKELPSEQTLFSVNLDSTARELYVTFKNLFGFTTSIYNLDSGALIFSFPKLPGGALGFYRTRLN